MSALKLALLNREEKGLIGQGSREYLEELFDKFPENTWFSPTNLNGSDDYTKCKHLCEYNLMCSKFVPNGRGGIKAFFLYRHDLKYLENL